ncbi:MAG: SulP family inorganic anion transporter [gamma proteobacterium symbiont of Bathyaustriella thionipta]|nr:SulP family inorganic anion transporter [gamma proteobacterium symbiont of Bathyaustriella thionipta]
MLTRLLRFTESLPGWRVLRDYRRIDLGADLLAGLVICLVLIPSVLAYAELAGSSPVGGMWAALAATLGYFLFASSRHVNVGPDGSVALLAGIIIVPLTGGDPMQGMIAGAWLALFTGIILISAALLKLGVIASFLSKPVLLGYLNGAAVVIVISQWGKLFGIELEQENLFMRLLEWWQKLATTNLTTLAVALVFLALLLLSRITIKKLPPLVPVFFIALLAGAFIDFEAMGLDVIGEIRAQTPHAVGFTLTLNNVAELAIGALGLSMLIFPEGVLLGRAMAEKHDYNIDADRELLALGSANILSGLLQGFSVGSSQTRTLVNGASGGRTQVANLASAAFLVLFVVLAADWLARLPQVAIGAILVFTGFSLIDIADVRHMFRVHRATALIALSTTLAVIFIGVLPGILLGTTLSVGKLLAGLARPQDALLGRVEGSDRMHDVGDDEQAQGYPGVVAYRFYGPLIFANVGYFIERLQGFIDKQTQAVGLVIIDASAITSIDYSASEKLRDFIEKTEARGIEVDVAAAYLPLREIGNSLQISFIADEFIFPDVAAAVEAFLSREERLSE